MHRPMTVPKLHPHINVVGVLRDQATLWLLSGLVFTTSGVFIGLTLQNVSSISNTPSSTSSSPSSSSAASLRPRPPNPFDNPGFTATLANSLFSLIHIYCSTVPVLRDHATGLLEIRHVYFFAAVLTGFVCTVGAAGSFLFSWKVSLLLGYGSATCGAVAAGQLAGAINPGVVVCRGGGVHTGGGGYVAGSGHGGVCGYGGGHGGGHGGMAGGGVLNGGHGGMGIGGPARIGCHYHGVECGPTGTGVGPDGKERCRCGGTLTTVIRSHETGTGTRSTGSDGAHSHGEVVTGVARAVDLKAVDLKGGVAVPGSEKDQGSEKDSAAGAGGLLLVPVQSNTGTVVTKCSSCGERGERKLGNGGCCRGVRGGSGNGDIGEACPGRLGSDAAAASVDMNMGIGMTGVSIM